MLRLFEIIEVPTREDLYNRLLDLIFPVDVQTAMVYSYNPLVYTRYEQRGAFSFLLSSLREYITDSSLFFPSVQFS